MLILFKHLQRFLTKPSLKVTTSFLPMMSSNTRSLRSRTLVKTEQDASDKKGPQNSILTSKYFQNKRVKEEPGVPSNSSVEKGTKKAKALKIKLEDQKMAKQEAKASTKSRKIPALKTVIKIESNEEEVKQKSNASTKARKMQAQKPKSNDSQIVKNEVLNDEDSISKSINTNSTLELQQGVKQESNKSAKARKKQTQKTVIKTEPKESQIVKTEVLSDDDFVPSSTYTSSTSELQQGIKQESNTSTRKGNVQAQKPVIKIEPGVSEIVKTEVLSDDDFTTTSTHSNSTSESQKGVGQKTRRTQAQTTVINASEIVKTEILTDDSQKGVTEKVSPLKRKQVQKAEKIAKVKTEHVQDVEDIVWQPENWRLVLDNILKMRKMHVAPVDSLGCEECPEKGISPEVFRYQTLISVMLSSQTRDEVTFAASQRLIAHGLTVDSILATSDEKIGELIYPAGFWKSKVKFIRNTTQILKDQYNGDIPRTFQGLCKLPGVGPKMANIVMSVGWNDTVGIAVDTHVHRISNRLGWVPKPTKDPEQTRKALEAWMPKALWKDVSLHLVGFGQTLCKPLRPKCQDCLNCSLCPSSTVKSVKKS